MFVAICTKSAAKIIVEIQIALLYNICISTVFVYKQKYEKRKAYYETEKIIVHAHFTYNDSLLGGCNMHHNGERRNANLRQRVSGI